MKKLKFIFLAFIASISIVACNTEDDLEFVAQETDGLVFTNSFSSVYVLTPIAADNLGERFTWSDVDYQVPTSVSYELQSSIIGDFSDASPIGTTTNREFPITIGQMLSLATAAGLDNDASTEEMPNTGILYFRLRSFLGDGSLESFSPISELNVELPEGDVEPELPKIYVVGSFLGASGYGSDWTPADAVPLASTGPDNMQYEGYVFMNVDNPEFKILPTNESFDGDYGDDGTFSGTLIQDGESNIQISGAGYYFIKVDLTDPDALTYSVELTNWAITGSATPAGWPDNGVMDQDMTYNADSRKWEITIALTTENDAAFKFRANDAWALNYGDAGADGILDFNDGTNLVVDTAGTYFIELDFSNPRIYTYTATLQ